MYDLPSPFLNGAALLLGLVVGSFLNVLILRLPRRMHTELHEACEELAGRGFEPAPNRLFGLDYLIAPPSHCPACDHRIRAWENIPILSYFLLRGRCSACGTSISARYPVVEGACGLLTVAVVVAFGATLQGLAVLFLVWGLLAMTVIDLDEQLLPDQLTLPLLWLGLLVNLDTMFVPIQSAIVGAAAGYLSLWLVFQVFRLLTGKEGMGYGDFKLFALLGAWLGWQVLPQILLLSSLVGAMIGIALVLVRGRDHRVPMPFGPFLAIGGLVALFFGDRINQAYLQFTGLG